MLVARQCTLQVDVPIKHTSVRHNGKEENHQNTNIVIILSILENQCLLIVAQSFQQTFHAIFTFTS